MSRTPQLIPFCEKHRECCPSFTSRDASEGPAKDPPPPSITATRCRRAPPQSATAERRRRAPSQNAAEERRHCASPLIACASLSSCRRPGLVLTSIADLIAYQNELDKEAASG